VHERQLGIAQLLEGCLHDNSNGVMGSASFDCYQSAK